MAFVDMRGSTWMQLLTCRKSPLLIRFTAVMAMADSNRWSRCLVAAATCWGEWDVQGSSWTSSCTGEEQARHGRAKERRLQIRRILLDHTGTATGAAGARWGRHASTLLTTHVVTAHTVGPVASRAAA